MSAVGDSGTSKYRSSHIKQATLIPALLLGSVEWGFRGTPNSPLLLSPTHPRPGLTRALPFPSPLLLMPRELAKRRCHTLFNCAASFGAVSKLRSHSAMAVQTDLLTDSPKKAIKKKKINQQTKNTQQMQPDVKTTSGIRHQYKRTGIKIQCR